MRSSVRLSMIDAAVLKCNITVWRHPRSKEQLRDALANMGVQRLCYLGEGLDVPPGTPHDGSYEMQRLARWVVDEGPEP